jgi:hypothetical protein
MNSILENTLITIKAGIIPICPTTKRILIGHHQVNGWGVFYSELALSNSKRNKVKDKLIEAFRKEINHQVELEAIPLYSIEDINLYVGVVPEEFPPNLGNGYDNCMWVSYIDLVMISPMESNFKEVLRKNTSKIITCMAG